MAGFTDLSLTVITLSFHFSAKKERAPSRSCPLVSGNVSSRLIPLLLKSRLSVVCFAFMFVAPEKEGEVQRGRGARRTDSGGGARRSRSREKKHRKKRERTKWHSSETSTLMATGMSEVSTATPRTSPKVLSRVYSNGFSLRPQWSENRREFRCIRRPLPVPFPRMVRATHISRL